jgi:hypothetical protein
MTMPYEVFEPEQLTANSVDLLGPAWLVLDLANLWQTQWFWDNRVAPGSAGTRPFNAEEDELRTSLPFWVGGGYDHNGDPHPDTQTGFWRNWQYLSDNVWNGYVISCTYQPPDPDADPIGFQAQFSAPQITERHPTDWKGTLGIILPSGALRATGS